MEQFYLEKKDIFNRYLLAHHLYPRLSPEGMVSATHIVGFKEFSVYSYGVALAARINNLNRDMVNELWSSNELMRTLGGGGQVRIIPRKMWGVFNKPLTPLNESELQHMAAKIEPLIVALDISMYQMYGVLVGVTKNILKGNSLNRNSFYRALSEAVIDELEPSKREIWLWPSTVGEGQTLGDTIIEFLLPAVGFSVPISLDRIPGKPGYHYNLANTSEEPHSVTLVRHFIHSHGPTNFEELSDWATISPSHAKRLWLEFPQDDLVTVHWEGNSGSMLLEDYNQLGNFLPPEGLRFIGPYDPLLYLKHRNVLVNGKTLFNYFFRSNNRPGMVIHDGEVVAGWRFRGKNKTFSLLIEDIGQPFGRIATNELMTEISHIGDVLGMKSEGFSLVNA